ncbi:MAG: YCF48-related protein [Xanthomonadales bacterium]|nr:YCF48-related protein [Xanthomonadales bacterium]
MSSKGTVTATTLAAACLLAVGAFHSLARADSGEIQYAELQPLAAQALLLDVLALPEGGYVAVGARGHVVLSQEGSEWRQAGTVPTRSTLTSVAEADGKLWAAGHDSVIITSTDGGEVWTRQYFAPERGQPIMDIRFFDKQNGIAIGAYGLAMVTDDGGRNWEDSYVNEDEWHNNALLADGDTMVVAAEAGFTYRSEDHGDTWETIEMPYPGSMFGVTRTFNECLLVFGLRGNVQESCDEGVSWEELETGTEASIMGGLFDGQQNVLVGNSGLVLTRRASGDFQVNYHGSGVDFAAVAGLGNGSYLLVGEDGVHHWPEHGDEGAP